MDITYRDLLVVGKLEAKIVSFHEVEVVAHGIQQHFPRGSLLGTNRAGVTASETGSYGNKPRLPPQEAPHARVSKSSPPTALWPPATSPAVHTAGSCPMLLSRLEADLCHRFLTPMPGTTPLKKADKYHTVSLACGM